MVIFLILPFIISVIYTSYLSIEIPSLQFQEIISNIDRDSNNRGYDIREKAKEALRMKLDMAERVGAFSKRSANFVSYNFFLKNNLSVTPYKEYFSGQREPVSVKPRISISCKWGNVGSQSREIFFRRVNIKDRQELENILRKLAECITPNVPYEVGVHSQFLSEISGNVVIEIKPDFFSFIFLYILIILSVMSLFILLKKFKEDIFDFMDN